jgi:hypothetical protein
MGGGAGREEGEAPECERRAEGLLPGLAACRVDVAILHVLLDVFIHCGRFHGQWARR